MTVASRPDVRALEDWIDQRAKRHDPVGGYTVHDVWLAACAWQRAFDAAIARRPKRLGLKGVNPAGFEAVARAIEGGVG